MSSGDGGTDDRDGVRERLESGDESAEFSPSGTKDIGLEGAIVDGICFSRGSLRVESLRSKKRGAPQARG